MKLFIELPDDQASELSAPARAEGLSLKEWIQRLAARPASSSQPDKHIADILSELMSDVPPEVMAAMPTDGINTLTCS
jgi:hypothetical protein